MQKDRNIPILYEKVHDVLGRPVGGKSWVNIQAHPQFIYLRPSKGYVKKTRLMCSYCQVLVIKLYNHFQNQKCGFKHISGLQNIFFFFFFFFFLRLANSKQYTFMHLKIIKTCLQCLLIMITTFFYFKASRESLNFTL